MHFLGVQGMPRRYPDYAPAFEYWNHIASIGYHIMAASLVIFFINVVYAFVAGKRAAPNYWGEGATTLEWTLSSPPPTTSSKPSPSSKTPPRLKKLLPACGEEKAWPPPDPPR
jgi:cytochrome c oxidase subunit 1